MKANDIDLAKDRPAGYFKVVQYARRVVEKECTFPEMLAQALAQRAGIEIVDRARAAQSGENNGQTTSK